MDKLLEFNKTNENLETITMETLYDQTYTGGETIVESLFNTGTYIFAGDPKVGKSFFLLQLAYAVSRGEKFLDKFETKKSTVLYLALEDTYKRLQMRMHMLFGAEPSPDLHISIKSKMLGNGLENEIENFVANHENTKLVIIDTFAKVRNEKSEKYSYAKDYNVISQIKAISDALGICIILAHHTNKQFNTESGMQRISGTTGIAAGSDGNYILSKKDYSATAALDMSCRDLPNQKIILKQENDSPAWLFKDIENEVCDNYINPTIEKVADFVIGLTSKNWSGTVSELLNNLNLEMKANALSRTLNAFNDELRDKYNIDYSKNRTSSERTITLKYNGNADSQNIKNDDNV